MSSTNNTALDAAAGKAQMAQGESLSTLIASLTTSGIILVAGVLAYVLLKLKFPVYYARRESNPSWKLALSPRSLFLPPPDPYFKHTSEIDNYFFGRYLHTITRIFLLLGLIISPILIPMNVVGGKNEAGGVKGLDRLSFSNVGLSHTDRYWAHLAVAIFAIVSVCHILRLELRDYTRVKRSVGASGSDAYSDTSLLLIANSKKQLSVRAVWRHFHKTAGGVHAIKPNRDYSSLRANMFKRDALIRSLETAETNLVRKANLGVKLRQSTKHERHGSYDHSKPLWIKYLKQEDRPSIRLPLFPWLPSLPFVGPQADAIYHFRAEVARFNLEIEWDQRHPDKFSLTNSVFVYFNHRIPTTLATLALKTGVPPSWTLKQGTAPNDTIWHNVTTSWWQQCIRTVIVYILSAMLTLGFAFPAIIIGSLSQIEYLANILPWLRGIDALPHWLTAAIQGVLTPVILAAIVAMVPVVLRLLANMQGLHSRQAVENCVQIYYFAFLFIQVFLAVSLSAGTATVIGELSGSVKAVPAVLAQNLPKACNYFFSYILIHTFTTIVSVLVKVSDLVHLAILSPILDKTARQKWMREESLGLQRWGTFLPVFTNIACIGLTYSVIAPLILVCSTICFGALSILYRFYPPNLTEKDLVTCGLFYPTAIRQLFTGIYFMELCTAGLFFLVRDADNRAACLPHAVIMIVATTMTALFQYALDHGFKVQWLILQRIPKENGVSATKPRIIQGNPAQDEVLSTRRPVVWIPKDELGIADNEISSVKRTYESIWISNEGASIDERGKLDLWGPPPKSSK
ncbi:hypothetical protein D0Z07_9212 [Hyphodiscus hymeniophilus]|uniref:DUF221-domain-containing protein n=1 Tax=Hyphodiscus hymeniophilus TaxID=353542 RepID=A0A9P6SJY8_9HELO|nr:hypothetical protein D0Z07_9212 [Hyphodiscus hymeniophilus]